MTITNDLTSIHFENGKVSVEGPFTANCCKDDARGWDPRESLQLDFSVESSDEVVNARRPDTTNIPVMKRRPGAKYTNEFSARAYRVISSLRFRC